MAIIGWKCRSPHRYVAPVRVPDFDQRPQSKALMDAISANDISAVKRLLDSGVSPDSVFGSGEGWGQSALSLAAANGDIDIVRLLVSRGADVNAPDPWGGTPIIGASISGYSDNVEFLIANGADVDALDDGASALGYAMFQIPNPTDNPKKGRSDYLRIVKDLAGAHLNMFGL